MSEVKEKRSKSFKLRRYGKVKSIGIASYETLGHVHPLTTNNIFFSSLRSRKSL